MGHVNPSCCVTDCPLPGQSKYQSIIQIRKNPYAPGLQRKKCGRNAPGKDLRGERELEWEHLELVHPSLKGKTEELPVVGWVELWGLTSELDTVC